MQYALTRNVKKISIGQVSYSAMCYENGCMIDDGTIFRLGKDNFRWIGGQEYGGTWLRELAKKKNYKVWVKSSTDQIHNISVQGPNSRKILEKFVWTPPAQATINELKWFRFSIARIDDHIGIPIIVSRTGYTGELGFEIWCHPKDAPKVWEKVWESGKGLGLTPMGLEGLDMVRIEAGLIFYGYEFNDQTDPFESGIGFSVALKTKEDDFVGKDALIKRKESPQKKLVGLELIGKEQASNGDGVHVGRATVGVITSGMISPKLSKNIALCRMDVKYSDIGTDIEVGKIDGHQKRIPAKVVAFPFYDPKKLKVRT
jgi:aminomethyltransferase